MLEEHGGAGHTVGGTAAARGSCPNGGTRAVDSYLPRAASPQFPIIHRRANRVSGRHLDAERRPKLACLPFDTLRVAARHIVVLLPDRRLCTGPARRISGRPILPPEARSYYADAFHVAGAGP